MPEIHEFGSDLLAAVREGDEEAALNILQTGQSMRVPWNEESDNLLLYACLFRCSEKVACALIAHGISISEDYAGHSILHFCIRADWAAAAEALLQRGACLQKVDLTGKTLLHHACWLENVACVQWLLSHGLDPLQEDSRGDTPFSLAQDSPLCTALVVAHCQDRMQWSHILGRSLEDLSLFVSKSDLYRLFSTAACSGKQRIYFSDSRDVYGGSLEEDSVGQRHKGRRQICKESCAGLLLQPQILKLVVDGKQKVLANSYSMVTLSFLVQGQTASNIWLSESHKKSEMCRARTKVAFLQALVQSESETNIAHLLQVACQMGKQDWKLNLASQVVHVQEGHGNGIQAFQKGAFTPFLLACNSPRSTCSLVGYETILESEVFRFCVMIRSLSCSAGSF